MEKPVLNETPLPVLAKIYCITLGLGLLFGLSNLLNIFSSSVALMGTPNAWIAWFEIGASIAILVLDVWILFDLLNRKWRFLYVLYAFVGVRLIYMIVMITLDMSLGVQALGAALVPVAWAIYFNNSKKLKLAFSPQNSAAVSPTQGTFEPDNDASSRYEEGPHQPEEPETSQPIESSMQEINSSVPETPENATQDSNCPASVKKLFCKHCGVPCDSTVTHCPNCGKRVRIFSRLQSKSRITRISLLVSIVVNIFLLLVLVPTLIMNFKLQKTYETMSQTITSLHSEMDSLNSSLKAKQTELERIRIENELYYSELLYFESNIAFVVDPNGGVYHSYNCHFFKNSNTYWAYNVEQAEYMGYRPCEVCH